MPIDKNQTEVLAPCISGCPQDNDIRAVLTTINHAEEHGLSREESFEKAWRIFTRTNPLPAICGRVCPHPCETDCNRGENPIGLARKFPKLHVIAMPADNDADQGIRTCREIAQAGRGKFYPINEYKEIPRALINLLTQT